MKRIKSIARAIKRGKVRVTQIAKNGEMVIERRTNNGEWVRYL